MAGLTQIVGKERRPRQTHVVAELGLWTCSWWLQQLGNVRAPIALRQFRILQSWPRPWSG